MKINKNLPNILCLIRIALVPLVILFIVDNALSRCMPLYGRVLVSGLVFGFAMITDTFDGRIARKYNCVSDMGKFLDPIADKLLVLGTMIAFVELGIFPSMPVVFILARELAVTGLRLIASSKGAVIAANKWGKAKTVSQSVGLAAVFFAMLYLSFGKISDCADFASASLCSMDIAGLPFFVLTQIIIWIIVAVSVLSAVPYFVSGAKYLKD